MKLELKRFLGLVLILSFTASLSAQGPEMMKAQREADKKKEQMKVEAKKALKEKIKRHNKMQTKRVQKELKNNAKATDSYYRWYNVSMLFRNLKTRKNKHR